MESGKTQTMEKTHQARIEVSPFRKVIAKSNIVPLRKTTAASSQIPGFKDIHLSAKEDFAESMRRIYAWYECQMIDRPPVRFAEHNSQYNIDTTKKYTPEENKERYFDTESVIDDFVHSIESKKFLGETLPVYWPNLGPDVYAAFYGSPLVFGEVTSWSQPIIKGMADVAKLKLDTNNEYFKKLDELTSHALERCEGKFLVGYTDLHPGMDCALAWRGMEQLCFDLIDNPDIVEALVAKASEDFAEIFNSSNKILKSAGQPSVNWMEIPSFEEVYIPSCDFGVMMSPDQFEKFALDAIKAEVKHATHNIFHLDGKGVARHLDAILEIPEITAIQWVQGVGEDLPIMQWIPLIKRIQDAGKGVIVDLKKHELEGFIDQMRPEGIFLWISENDESEQQRILKRLEKW